MAMVTTTTVLARPDSVFTSAEESALVGFLAGYSGLTREAYALDLRQFAQWSTERTIPLFGARRVDIEHFRRHLETLGRKRSTIARGCARLRASTGMPKKKASSMSHPPSTFVGLDSTTNRAPSASTATKSVRCSSPRASPVAEITHS
jgi:hypothetical protein